MFCVAGLSVEASSACTLWKEMRMRKRRRMMSDDDDAGLTQDTQHGPALRGVKRESPDTQ